MISRFLGGVATEKERHEARQAEMGRREPPLATVLVALADVR